MEERRRGEGETGRRGDEEMGRGDAETAPLRGGKKANPGQRAGRQSEGLTADS